MGKLEMRFLYGKHILFSVFKNLLTWAQLLVCIQNSQLKFGIESEIAPKVKSDALTVPSIHAKEKIPKQLLKPS